MLSLRKIKPFLAKKYLDWAEMLPRFQGGLIYSLQLTREHQRKWSERCYASSRAPEGTELRYRELVLIEVFELEDIDRLSGGLKKLFPNIKKGNELVENIERSAW